MIMVAALPTLKFTGSSTGVPASYACAEDVACGLCQRARNGGGGCRVEETGWVVIVSVSYARWC